LFEEPAFHESSEICSETACKKTPGDFRNLRRRATCGIPSKARRYSDDVDKTRKSPGFSGTFSCADPEYCVTFWICYGEYRGQRKLSKFRRYVESRYIQRIREDAYRFYVSDALKAIGRLDFPRYYDLINGNVMTEEEAKETAEEIKTNIKAKLRGLGGKNGHS